MGQQNSYGIQSNATLALQQQLPIGKIYKDQQNNLLYFIKEYSYTSQQAFQQAFVKFSTKLTSKHQNILDLQKASSKVQNSFCSTFYKIILVFQYINDTLEDEISMRNKQSRTFQEKEIWSILFHCTLAIAHLRKSQGFEHSAIGLKDIRLSQDGSIKVIPTQMIGISLQHDQKQGTTKKLAMTILSCILMKQVNNQSNQYLQALIDRTKCSKQLKKVLYLMIMQDSTFKEVQEYLNKLASDQNDSIVASGVSTPVMSSNKKSEKQSAIKAHSIIEALSSNQIFAKKNQAKQPTTLTNSSYLSPDKQDVIEHQNQLPSFFNNSEVQNPDQNDSDPNSDLLSSQQQNKYSYESKILQRNINSHYTQIQITPMRKYSNTKMIKQMNQEDETVRIIQNSSNHQLLAQQNNQNYVSQRQQKQFSFAVECPKLSDGLYTDPKLLDLIKKDLQQIQQKSRASFGGPKQEKSLNSLFKQPSSTNHISNQSIINQNSLTNIRQLKRNSIYNLTSNDFNLKPITSQSNSSRLNKNNQSLEHLQETLQKQSVLSSSQSLKQNPQGGVSNNNSLKIISSGSINTKAEQENKFKQIENIPRRAKQQQCYGNILDEEASFKKVKNNKKQTGIQSEAKKDLMKENVYGEVIEKQTKRILQNQNQQSQNINSYSMTSINENCQRSDNFLESNKKVTNSNKAYSQKKLVPQALKPQTSLENDLSPQMQLVTQTYQKGQYKGYKLNGLRHGTGTFFYKEGGKYVGQWRQNKMNGKGTLYYPNNEIAYQGNWKDDQLHGYGVLFNEQVSQLTGSFHYQNWSDVEQYWVKYQGQFNMDNKDGKGKWYLSNGQIFQGHFKNDMVDGQGILSRTNGSRIKGIWRQNQLLRLC